MPAPGRACTLSAIASLALLAACSNGRGSLDESQPPSQPGQQAFTVGGSVSGLTGSGLVLQNNDGAGLAITGNGTFTFTGSVANGAAYNVTVATQPSNPAQACTVSNGTGTITGANVTNVQVTCAGGEPGSFFVRGNVTGLAGSGLVLQNNGVDELAISADGAFVFPAAIVTGTPYNVTVRTQPTGPSQSCAIANGAGTMGNADVIDVAVTCTTGQFTLGGTVSGLSGTGAPGSGVTLQNNGGDALTLTENGSFVFPARLASGAAYNVTVLSHPTNPVQTCAVENPAGTMSDGNVTNVRVKCATNVYTVGGTVSGLAGSGLVLELNNDDRREITSNGVYAFEEPLRSGTAYFVRVRQQPTNPAQRCEVANAAGVVLGDHVGNIDVTCTTSRFSVGGTVSGLAGSGLVLQNNGGDDRAIASDGSFTFDTQLLSGTAYHVTVRTLPSNPSQTCTVQSASGTVGSGDVRNVRVTCATSTFPIGGTVTGLIGTGLVLQNNGGNPLAVSANGQFEFGNELASGATYDVTVRTQPGDPTQTCTVANGTGRVGSTAVTDIVVSCTTSEFTVGGTVSGLAGSNLRLWNNGTDELNIDADSSFTFGTPLPSGATYSVTVAAQPTSPDQLCSVERGSGTIGMGNVTDVAVVCSAPQEFTVGGQVSGYVGSGLVLTNNGADNLGIASDGQFTFQSSLAPGTPYSVTVATQPSTQTCSVENGAGTVGTADVTNVQVTCVNNP